MLQNKYILISQVVGKLLSLMMMYEYTKEILYNTIKNFAWEDLRQKWCHIAHIAPRGVNCAILFAYRTGYAYGKEPEGSQKVFLSPFSAG